MKPDLVYYKTYHSKYTHLLYVVYFVFFFCGCWLNFVSGMWQNVTGVTKYLNDLSCKNIFLHYIPHLIHSKVRGHRRRLEVSLSIMLQCDFEADSARNFRMLANKEQGRCPMWAITAIKPASACSRRRMSRQRQQTCLSLRVRFQACDRCSLDSNTSAGAKVKDLLCV